MSKAIVILLADDDADDRFFFHKVIKFAAIPASLYTVEDGEKLMQYLGDNPDNLPDALFLDLNMPRKNGSECLKEIKLHKNLRKLPVIIYSTSLHTVVADVLYNDGAHYYVKKTDMAELQGVLNYVLHLVSEKKLVQPSRDGFILNSNEINIQQAVSLNKTIH